MSMYPVHILLAEDNPGDARLISELLGTNTTDAYRLTHVMKFAELVEAMNREEFDILLLDLSMPDAGCPTIERLLALQALKPTLPIIILSGLLDEEFSLSAVQCGIQDYLVKGYYTNIQLWRVIRYGIERKRTELRMARMTLYDGVTGLANRTLFLDRLQQAVIRIERGSLDGVALIVIEIEIENVTMSDGLDSHSNDDGILKTISERLEHCMRRSDTVGRLASKTFGLLLEGITSKRTADIAVTKLHAALDAPMALNGEEFKISVGVGVVCWPERSTNIADLIKSVNMTLHNDTDSKHHTIQQDANRMLLG